MRYAKVPKSIRISTFANSYMKTKYVSIFVLGLVVLSGMPDY
jgi:hypothetical protein